MDDDTLRVAVDGSNPHLPPVMVLLGRGSIGRGRDRRAESMLRRVDSSSGLGVQPCGNVRAIQRGSCGSRQGWWCGREGRRLRRRAW